MSTWAEPRIVTEQAGEAVLVVVARGEHDLSTVDALREEINAAFELGSGIIADLSAVTFIDARTLGALLEAHAHAEASPGRRFAVVAPFESVVARLFQVTRADRVLAVFETWRAAAAWCRTTEPGNPERWSTPRRTSERSPAGTGRYGGAQGCP
jgi:anti-anti-sigma factor